jgi:hypothetical protein
MGKDGNNELNIEAFSTPDTIKMKKAEAFDLGRARGQDLSMAQAAWDQIVAAMPEIAQTHWTYMDAAGKKLLRLREVEAEIQELEKANAEGQSEPEESKPKDRKDHKGRKKEAEVAAANS